MSEKKKRRFRKRYALGLILLALTLWPILYIELGCGPTVQASAAYRPILTNEADRRPEVNIARPL